MALRQYVGLIRGSDKKPYRMMVIAASIKSASKKILAKMKDGTLRQVMTMEYYKQWLKVK
jgi:hypothetical protein